MLVLAIDTSTRSGSVALLQDTSILAEVFVYAEKNHSETIMPAIEWVFKIAGICATDLDLLSFAIGPGSFTGLRIGASIVKGLALATGKPVTGVSSLEALAYNLPLSRLRICPMLDAKRAQVYSAVYSSRGTDSFPQALRKDSAVDPWVFLKSLQGKHVFLGDGAQRYFGLISEIMGTRAIFVPGHANYIRASCVGLLGARKLAAGEVLDLLRFTPVYLRSSGIEPRVL